MYLRIRDCQAPERQQVLALQASNAVLASAGVTYGMCLAIIEQRSALHPSLDDAAVAACIERAIDAALRLLPAKARKKARIQLVVTGS